MARQAAGQGRANLILLLVVLLIPAVLGSSQTIFNDGDVSWHIATGQWILDHRAIPVTDPFSFTWAGKPWVAFEFVARDAGAFMVHCGTPPVTMHVMQGMYLPIIVDPRNGWGTKADKEFVLVQSEFYAKGPDSTAGSNPAAPMQPDWPAAMMKNPSQVVFNGRAFQYKDSPLKVSVGDRVRLFVINAGPSFNSDFHIVGAIFDRVYPDGDPSHALENVQTYMVPAGGGAVFETVFDKDASGEGLYPFVTHSFADAEKGGVGIIQVGTPKRYITMSH
jgi:nitrite reductase (NO-forming)